MAANLATTLPVHRLELDAYNQIVSSGALDGQRVELLEGVVVDMSPQSLAHAVVIERLTRHFAHAHARLRVQLPIEVPPRFRARARSGAGRRAACHPAPPSHRPAGG